MAKYPWIVCMAKQQQRTKSTGIMRQKLVSNMKTTDGIWKPQLVLENVWWFMKTSDDI